MPKDGQTRLGWDRFDGGIELVPERAQPGQVLDARNIWAPYGPAERRPGTRFVDSLIQAYDVPQSGSRVDTYDSVADTWTVTYTLSGISTPIGSNFVPYALSRPLLSVVGGYRELPLVSGPSLSDFTDLSATRVFQLSGLSGADVGSTAEMPVARFTPEAVPFALAELPWGAPLAVIYVFEVTDTSGAVYTVFAASAHSGGRTSSFITGTSITETKSVTAGEHALWIKKQPHTASRLSTLAPIPFFDIIFITYNYTIYQLTPSGGFDLAVVNTDPDLVGPRTVDVTPTYSVDRLAQLASPPRANIVTYFDGFVFALDIVGEQYNVRWSAPIIGTGQNLVWPVVSFEPIDEDGGRPRAAKPLTEFLVVYQAFNIYTFVNDGVDATTGQPTFAPKRVCSGVGTEAHNGVVEVQGRHFFPARDGFYAFDGNPIPQKLSQPIDQFYQSLGRSALATSRGVHWPEKHCVLWTVRQGAATDPHGLGQQMHYIILYDYVKNAWWIWDNVAGGGGLARMFTTDVQAGIYILSSVALLYRLTGNSDGLPGATWDGLSLLSTSLPADLPAAYILTHRLGEPSFQSLSLEEMHFEASTGIAQAEVTVILDDDSTLTAATQTVDFTNENDTLWGKAVWGKSNWQANRRRVVPGGHTGLVGKHVNLKIAAVNAFNRAWNVIRAAVYATKRFGEW